MSLTSWVTMPSPGLWDRNIYQPEGSKKARVGGFHSSAGFNADITPSEADKTVYSSKVSGTDWTEDVSFTNTLEDNRHSWGTDSTIIKLRGFGMMSARLCVCFMRTTIPPPSAIPKTCNSGSGTGKVGVKLSDILQTVTIYIKMMMNRGFCRFYDGKFKTYF